jgi:hypothetical protein
MYVKYLGVANSAGSRIYTFHVIDPPHEIREFSVKIPSEEFSPGRLKFQDGPGISSARLQRELKVETQESRADANLGVEEQDVREYRAQHYPEQKPLKRSDAKSGLPPVSSPPARHFQNRGYAPLGPTQHNVSEEITTLLLHEPGDAKEAFRLALERQSVSVCCFKSCQEALPPLTGPDPPHLIFTQPNLPDGIWADVVDLAMKAAHPVNVIVVGRPADVNLYMDTVARGAFDFIVAPLTSNQLTHVVRCAIENVLARREAQAHSA